GAVDYLIKDHLGREQLLRSIRYALARSEIQNERYERIRAEAASRSKSEFLAVLSHEIRTPLTAIIGYTELLLHRRPQDADLSHKLQVINRNSAHLLSLLNDTLDLSKIEAGKLETDSERIELGPFVMNSLVLMREMATAKNLLLQVSSRTALPRYIQSDPMRLRQILFNLLNNAIKFTDVGTVELQVKLDGRFLEFHVLDTGKGMSRGDLKKIFLPFAQVTQGKQGTGLGLTISQKLAHTLGGSIIAHSIEGGGSRFIARIDPGVIDLNEQADFVATSDVVTLPPSTITHVGGYIIVVDDVEDLRDLIGNVLVEAGIKVLKAASGQEVLQLLATHRQDVAMVLMDLNMPGLDGFQTLHLLRDAGHAQPVIALTAATLKGDREKCLHAGFSAYLAKPVTTLQLLAEIKKQLPQPMAEPPVKTGGDILVVEDNRDANAAICLLLQLLGYQTRAAHDKTEAMALFNEQTPHQVVADLNLGDTDGMDLLHQLHGRAPDVRYFVLSGNLATGQRELPSFLQGFIAKPVTLDTLSAALASADS
ncbi:MAG: response regulator, partial [Pseudomonadota bacterium]